MDDPKIGYCEISDHTVKIEELRQKMIDPNTNTYVIGCNFCLDDIELHEKAQREGIEL